MIRAAIEGYHRRRGWLAWHIATLGRCDAKDFPDLDKLTGDRRERAAQSPDEIVAVLRQWKSALGAPAQGTG